jgi:hypothetical protein
MPDRVKVRGCCCGVPFSCGMFVVLGSSIALWKLVLPGIASLLAMFAR